MASAKLSRTAGTASNTYKATISAWVKRATPAVEHRIFTGWGGTNAQSVFTIGSDDRLVYQEYNGSFVCNYQTNRLLRDTSAFYHLMVAIDTTLSTATDRVKIYINGLEQRTNGGFSTDTQIAQNTQLFLSNYSSGQSHNIGARDSENYFDGLITHVHLIDGTQYAATDFGETDSTSGIWKPKTSPSVTYGNNGFFLKFENSGAMGTDSSGNSNTFTVNGTLTQNVDTPSNNFALLNRLDRSRKNTNNGGDYLFKGNLTFDTTSANGMMAIARSTLGVQSGKWYWEAKIIDNTRMSIGITKESIMGITDPYYDVTDYLAVAMNLNGTITGRYTGSASDEFSSGTSNTTNDIIGFALDMDNKELYIHKNGTYISNGSAVGVPTSGASRTGGLIDALTGSRDDYLPDGELIFPFVHDVSTTGGVKVEFNFGQGYFGTTSVATANADDGGLGIMEYDVPANYRVLCTKNIKDYG